MQIQIRMAAAEILQKKTKFKLSALKWISSFCGYAGSRDSSICQPWPDRKACLECKTAVVIYTYIDRQLNISCVCVCMHIYTHTYIYIYIYMYIYLYMYMYSHRMLWASCESHGCLAFWDTVTVKGSCQPHQATLAQLLRPFEDFSACTSS